MLRFVPLILGFGLLLGGAVLAGCQTEERSVMLTTVAQVEEAGTAGEMRGRPVQVNGVVTYVDSSWGLIVFQDETGGAFIHMPRPNLENRVPGLQAGQHIEVEGIVATPDVGLDHMHVRALENASFPEPQTYTISELGMRVPVGHWVQVPGVVQSATVQNQRLVLMLWDGADRVRVRVRSHSSVDPQSLVGARVRIQGVCVPSLGSDAGQPVANVRVNFDPMLRAGGQGLQDFELVVPSGKHITVQDSAQRGAVRSIAAVKNEGASAIGNRVRVRGVIRRQSGGAVLLVGDKTGTIRVQPTQRFVGTPGDSVDVMGFVATAAGQSYLRNARMRSTTERRRAVGDAISDSLPQLTTVQAVRRLSEEEARHQYPVQVEGVVTYADPGGGLLFVQDRTAGVFVFADSVSTQMTAGRRVYVQGVSAPGEFAPTIESSRVRVLGEGTLPSHPETSLRQFFAGRADAQWVEVGGTVQAFQEGAEGHHFLTLDADVAMEAGVEQFGVQMPPHEVGKEVPGRLIGAEVRVQGVAATVFNDRRQLVGVRVFVPGWEYIDIRAPGPSDPYAAPRQSISSLLSFSAESSMDRMVRVEGTVTHRTREGDFYVQDHTGAALVKVGDGFDGPPARPGDRVEAVGFEAAGSYNPVLENAQYRTLGTAPAPLPIVLNAANLLNGRFADRLVQLEGELLDHVVIAGQQVFTMRAGGHVFNAYMNRRPDSLGIIEAGARLRLTGVYDLQAGESEGSVMARTFELRLRSPTDVAVVEPAPWWGWWHTLGLLGMMGVLILGVVGWGATLRRQVRKQTEFIREKLDALRRANSDLKNLLVSTNIGTLFLDRELRIQRYTPRVEDLFDIRPEDEGRPIGALPRRVEYDELEADARRVLRDLDTVEREVKTEEDEWFLVRLRPYRTVDDEVEGVGITFVDVTERRQLETKLRQAHKMKTVGTLAGGIAHEFNNVLHAVAVYLDLARGEVPDDHDAREFFDRTERGIEQAELLADKLLTFSAPDSTTVREQVEMAPLVQDALDLAASSLADSLTLDTQLDDGSVVMGDPDQFQQVVLNLVTNAGWMAEGQNGAESVLAVRLRRVEIGDGEAVDGPLPLDSGSYVQLSVRCPGVDLDAETKERIFDPFFTLDGEAWSKAPKKGTGLGLSVAYSAVDAHGGEISVHSGDGEGTTFDVYLPAASDPSSPSTVSEVSEAETVNVA